MNGDSLTRQFTGTSQAKDVAKSAAKKTAKNAVKNEAKNAVKNATTEKQLSGIYHNCLHFGLGTLLAARFLDPFPGDLAVSQAFSQCSATRGRT